MKYFFSCPACGVYETLERTFNRFVARNLLQKLKEKQGTVGAVFEFEEFCPRCRPVSQKKVVGTLRVYVPKKPH